MHGQHREVRYAVPRQIHPDDVENGVLNPDTLVPIRCKASQESTDGSVWTRWIPGPYFPAQSLVRLYVPEED